MVGAQLFNSLWFVFLWLKMFSYFPGGKLKAGELSLTCVSTHGGGLKPTSGISFGDDDHPIAGS